MKYLIIFIVFFSFNVFGKENELTFNFRSTTCADSVNINKIFNSENATLVFNVDEKLLWTEKRKVTLNNNKYKGNIKRNNWIELKRKNVGSLKGYYNNLAPNTIILTFWQSNKKYKNFNDCKFHFALPVTAGELSRQEKIVTTLAKRSANKIYRTVGGDLDEINVWTLNILQSLKYMESIDKVTERRKTEDKIIKDGIAKFGSKQQVANSDTSQTDNSDSNIISDLSEIQNPKTKVVSPVLRTSMDDDYMLFWRQIGKRSKAKTETISDIVVDIVTIKHGEFNFVKLGKNFKIQQENREKIIFKLKQDHFIITGNLDLNTGRKTQPVYIKGLNKPNDKGQYIAETLYEKRGDTEKILQVVLQPIFNEKEAAKVCLYHAGSVTECQRHITCSYEDNVYACSREYERVESQCTYVDGIYSCNGKVIDVFAQKKAEEEKKIKAQELAAKKKKEEEARKLAAKKKKDEEEAKKKAQELAAKKKKDEELKQKLSKKIQELLSILGVYKGSIDGSFGQESLQALNEWRTANNLNKVQNIDEINEKELLLLEKNTDEFIQNKKKEELAKKKAEEEKKRKELVKLEKEKQIAQHYINDLLTFIKSNPNEFDIITLSELMISNKDILEGKWDKKLQKDFELLQEYTKTVDPFVQFLKDQKIIRQEALIAKIASENAKITNFINSSKNYLQNNITSSLAPKILKQIKLAEEILQIDELEKKKDFNEYLNEFVTENNMSEALGTEGFIDKSKETDFAVNIKKVQEYLKILNLYEGPIDGSFGPASLRSLNQWQKDNNLEILLSIYEMNEKQFNYLEQKATEFTENIETANKLKLEKSDDQKKLAQIFINDLLEFIKNNRNEFDIITLTELMVSNKDILEGKWDGKLQKDFELLNEYTLESELFNKFHLTQNENRQNLLIAEINKINETLDEAIEYFKFYLKNNITSSLAPDVIKQIKIAEKGIAREDKQEKNIYLDQLISFINSNELTKDYTNFITTTDDLIQTILDIAKLDSENEKNLAMQKIIEENLYPISEQDFIDNYTDKIIYEKSPLNEEENFESSYYAKDGYFSFLFISLNDFTTCDGSWDFKANYIEVTAKHCYFLKKEGSESKIIFDDNEWHFLVNYYKAISDSVAFSSLFSFDSAYWVKEKIIYGEMTFIENIISDLALIDLHKNLSNLNNFGHNYFNNNYELDLTTVLDKSKNYTPTDLTITTTETTNKIELEKEEETKVEEAELAEKKKEEDAKSKEEELTAKQQKKAELREKQLARTYINDLLEFIKINQEEFDVIILSGLMVSNKDILEGKWSEKLEKDFELLKEFTLTSASFEKYHLTQNENRQNQLIAEIKNINENLYQTIEYFKFYLQNNMTSLLVPKILDEIKNAEKGIAIQDIVVKKKLINQLIAFIVNNKLRKDYYSFLDSIKPQVVPEVDTGEIIESINNNKLLNIEFIKEIDANDLVVLANLSGKAPNAIRNLSGETIFENDEAISCFYQSKKIPKNKRFYYFDKISERKFLINLIDIECRQDQLLNYDLILFIKKDLLKENQEYASKLILQIQSGDFEQFSVISQKQYEDDILERKRFSEQIKKDIIDGVRLGFGSVAIKNDSTTLCSDIKDNQATHKSIINLLKNEFMRLGYGKIVEKLSFKDKERTFIDVQRGRCGFLYVGQDSFSDFIKGFKKTKTEYEIMPVWYSPAQIAAEQERLNQIENQRLIDLQKKKEDEEKKSLLKEEKLKSEGKIKARKQQELREKNRSVFESHVDLFEKEATKLFNPNESVNSLLYYQYDYLRDFIDEEFKKQWRIDNFKINPLDYGLGEYRKRKIAMFIVSLDFKLKNNALGEYSPHCFYLSIMRDNEFESWRDPFINVCEDTTKFETYKKKHQFKSEWVVN